MTDLSNPIGHRREQALVEHLVEVRDLIDELKIELPNINDATLHPLVAMLIATGSVVFNVHGNDPKSNVADDLAALMSAVRAIRIPVRDPDLGRTPTLDRLRKSKGLIVAGLADALDAAAAIGLIPQKSPLPQELAANLPRVEVEGLLKGIMKRLENVESSLRALDRVGREPTDFVQQQGLLNFYVGSMRVEIGIAKLHLAVGLKTVDINALARAVEAMTGLTRDFVSTVRAWTARVAEEVVRVANQLPKQVRTVASGVRATVYWTVRVLRRRRGRGQEDVTAKSKPVDVTPDISGSPTTDPPLDFDLGRAHEMILRGEAPPKTWWPFIIELEFTAKNISDLSPLSGLANLRRLDLDGTEVRDLSALSRLANLERLQIAGTQISDVSPLSGLTNLRVLSLFGTQVADLSPLSGLTHLDWLDLSRTPISYVSTLSHLTDLQGLTLADTSISALSALSGLAKLKFLNLDRTPVRDVSALSQLANLEVLYLSQTLVSGVSALSGLTNLRELSLAKTRVSDLSALSRLAKLEWVDLDGTHASDVSALSGLANLQRLDLKNTQVRDLSTLFGLPNLWWLDLDSTEVDDVSGLSRLTNLAWLYLGGTQVSDVSALSSLANLEDLSLADTRVSDVSALSKLAVLARLNLAGTHVVDLSPVDHVTTVIAPDGREISRSQSKKK